MSVNDLRRQLTVKGLQDSEFVSPLRKFRGVLKDYDASQDAKYTNADGSARVRAIFKFEDVEVLETQPGMAYNFPVAEVTIGYSNRSTSKWGIWAKSLELIHKDWDVGDLLGKRMTWGLKAHNMYSGKDASGQAIMKDQDCWEILEIEGASVEAPAGGGMDPRRTALSILFGKTRQEFEAQVLKDQSVKKDGSLVTEIIGNHFIPAMEASGFVHKDGDGRYQAGPE